MHQRSDSIAGEHRMIFENGNAPHAGPGTSPDASAPSAPETTPTIKSPEDAPTGARKAQRDTEARAEKLKAWLAKDEKNRDAVRVAVGMGAAANINVGSGMAVAGAIGAEMAAETMLTGMKNPETETPRPDTPDDESGDLINKNSGHPKEDISEQDVQNVQQLLQDSMLQRTQELAADLPNGDTITQELAKNFLAWKEYKVEGGEEPTRQNVKRVEGFAVFEGFVRFAFTGLRLFGEKMKGLDPKELEIMEAKVNEIVQRLQTGFNDIGTHLLDKPYIERSEKSGVKLNIHFKSDNAMQTFSEKFFSEVKGGDGHIVRQERKGVTIPHDFKNVVQFENADPKVVEFALTVLKEMHEGSAISASRANGEVPQASPETPSAETASSPSQSKNIESGKSSGEVITLSIEDTVQVINGRIERTKAAITDTKKEKETGGATLLMKIFGRGVQKAHVQAFKEEQSSLRKLETALRVITELKTRDEKPDQKLATLRQVRGQLGLPEIPAELMKKQGGDYDQIQKAILTGVENGDMNPDYKVINAQLAELDANLAKVERALQVADTATDYLPGVPGLVKIAGLVAQDRMTPKEAARELAVGILAGKIGSKALKATGVEKRIVQWVENNAKHFTKEGMEKLVQATKSGTEDAMGGSYLMAEELARGIIGGNEKQKTDKKNV